MVVNVKITKKKIKLFFIEIAKVMYALGNALMAGLGVAIILLIVKSQGYDLLMYERVFLFLTMTFGTYSYKLVEFNARLKQGGFYECD